jgi:hypothetical protein
MNMYHMGDARNLLALVPIVVLCATPFFFAGVCVAHLVSSAGQSVHRVYFSDLIGSGAGALLAIVLVNRAGAVAACFLAAGLAVAVAAATSRRHQARYGVLAAAIVVFAPFGESRSVLPLDVPPGKQLYGQEDTIETVRWHVITRLDVAEPRPCSCSFGGALSRRYDGPAPVSRLIFQDGANLTGILAPTPTPEETPVFGYYLQGAAYQVRPHARALVIGAGGGLDVVVALHNGAENVVAVDVNPKMVDLLKTTYADFSGNLYARADVEPVVSEGRHFLSADARKFDVIQLSGVDTWAALASGAYALTENFIYTAEAFDQYLAHLTPDGIVGFSRPRVEPPMETLKLSATAVDALERTGAREPARHVFIVSGFGQAADAPWAELLVKRSPFTESETRALGKWADRLGFDVIFDPNAEGTSPESWMLRANKQKRDALIAIFPLDVAPATDDVPFYFQFHRWRDFFAGQGLR